MASTLALSGRTRVIPIIGDPIAQVKAPGGVTAALNAQGHDSVVVPIHVTPADMDTFVRGATVARNVDAIIVTVPHKFAAYAHCETATDRAHFLRAVNTLRRNADGTWHGDALDGEAFVAGIRREGWSPDGPALLVGAGGAGSAIALALLDAGVPSLSIHDADTGRRDTLITRLRTKHGDRVNAGSDDPSGFALVANATPSGMQPGDPLPIRLERLDRATFVGDVVTMPAVPPLIEAARAIGCRTQTGIGMFNEVTQLIVDFLLHRDEGSR